MVNRRLANKAMLEAMRRAEASITAEKAQRAVYMAQHGSVRHGADYGASLMTDWSDDDRELMNSALDALEDKLTSEMDALGGVLRFAPRRVHNQALDGIKSARDRIKFLKTIFNRRSDA